MLDGYCLPDGKMWKWGGVVIIFVILQAHGHGPVHGNPQSVESRVMARVLFVCSFFVFVFSVFNIHFLILWLD